MAWCSTEAVVMFDGDAGDAVGLCCFVPGCCLTHSFVRAVLQLFTTLCTVSP